jgi:hypothetical protein
VEKSWPWKITATTTSLEWRRGGRERRLSPSLQWKNLSPQWKNLYALSLYQWKNLDGGKILTVKDHHHHRRRPWQQEADNSDKKKPTTRRQLALLWLKLALNLLVLVVCTVDMVPGTDTVQVLLLQHLDFVNRSSPEMTIMTATTTSDMTTADMTRPPPLRQFKSHHDFHLF